MKINPISFNLSIKLSKRKEKYFSANFLSIDCSLLRIHLYFYLKEPAVFILHYMLAAE